MEIKLFRFAQFDGATTGMIFIDNSFECFSLEDMYREKKVTGSTRIPSGRYRISLANWGGLNERYIKKFGVSFHKGMLMLNDVPNFSGILIHMGNTKQHTEGCILVGDISNPHNGTLSDSEAAYRCLYKKIIDKLTNSHDVFITVYDGNVLREIN